MSGEQIKPGYKRTEVGVTPYSWDVLPFRDAVAAYIDYRGRTPKKLGMDWGGGDILALSANNVQMGGINIAREAYYGSDELYRKWMTQGDCEQGDVLITMEAPLGNIAQIPDSKRYILSQRVLLIKPKSVLFQDFLAHYMRGSYFQGQLVANSSGSTALGIQRSRLDEIPIAVAPIHEQRAIATALSDVDTLLAQLDQLIAKKRDLKQATMQQLLTGQTRLPGFSGEWEVQRLRDFSRFLRNGTFSRAELEEQGNTHYLHYGDIHASNSARLDVIAASMPYLGESKARTLDRLECGDLVFADASEDYDGVGKSVEISNIGSGLVSGLHTIPIRFQKSILADGFKAYLQFIPSFRNHLLRLASGTKVYATQRSHIASAELKLPPVEEQTAIATVLSDMDFELAALEARRDKTRALKQGMMQELLTGRIRLV